MQIGGYEWILIGHIHLVYCQTAISGRQPGRLLS